jgi:uncharacterized cysteine cluster protein YcgN (CxxCxxCC family)
MVSIGNKSNLSDPKICQRCGKCCTLSLDRLRRPGAEIPWMQDKDIIVEDTRLQIP